MLKLIQTLARFQDDDLRDQAIMAVIKRVLVPEWHALAAAGDAAPPSRLRALLALQFAVLSTSPWFGAHAISSPATELGGEDLCALNELAANARSLCRKELSEGHVRAFNSRRTMVPSMLPAG